MKLREGSLTALQPSGYHPVSQHWAGLQAAKWQQVMKQCGGLGWPRPDLLLTSAPLSVVPVVTAWTLEQPHNQPRLCER